MNLKEFAKMELEIAGFFDKNSLYGGLVGDAVMELIDVFDKQGHSGTSAQIVRKLFNKVANGKPLTPLTFEDDEWEKGEGDTYQNKRLFSIFKKGKDGRPYNINAYKMKATFKDGHTSFWGGTLFVKTKEGIKKIKKCFIKNRNDTSTIIIDVPIIEHKYDWDFLPIEEEKLEELKKYYDIELVGDEK